MAAVQSLNVVFDALSKGVRVTYGTSVDFLEEIVLFFVFHATGTKLHLRPSSAKSSVDVLIVSNSLVVCTFSKQGSSVIVCYDFLVLVDQAALVAPCFTLFWDALEVLTATFVALR